MKLTIFFSWQTSSDRKNFHNKKFLLECIHKAASEVEKENTKDKLRFEVQDGTTGVPGTPEMIRTCEKRIDNCDIYIADLTIERLFSRFEKWWLTRNGKQLRSNPNTNVMNEIGRARGKKSSEQIILLMNTINGNPNENMPIDLSTLRYPITYLLKQDKKGNNDKIYDTTKQKVINSLKEAIKKSAKAAIDNLEKKLLPFINWKTHKEQAKFDGGYIWNDTLKELRTNILNNKNILRINGLSGLGKTRLVLESFRKDENKEYYLYCDCQDNDVENIRKTLLYIFENYPKLILILDNCDQMLQERIIKWRKSNNGENRLITIYNDPTESQDELAEYFSMQKEYDDVVEELLKRYKDFYRVEDKDKIKEFADGIPMMAELLVAGLRREKALGEINNETLMSKLLGVSKESKERVMLQSISLFDFIGFKNEKHKELEYISTNKSITSLNGEDEVIINSFDELVLNYLKRKIIERKGRLIGIRPTPIALYLVTEWLEKCTEKRLQEVIAAIQNSPYSTTLTAAFCDQFKNLGYSNRARMMMNEMLQENSPFGNAEVINTDLGSRLFRSFVEVNPEAVAVCLWNVISSQSIEQLKQMKTGRRNIVWTVEKLCFDGNTFETGTKIMMLLGLAENENIANNATNQFLSIFPILLGATEVNLNRRLLFLQKEIKIKGQKKLILKAIGRALHTRDFIYFNGAEKQGTKELKNYQPSFNEIKTYIKECLTLLMNEIYLKTSYSQQCFSILEETVGCLCSFGLCDLVIDCIEKAAEIKVYDWDSMLDSIQIILNSNRIQLTPEIKIRLKNIKNKLTKNDFCSRFEQVEKDNRFDYGRISWEEQIKYNEAKYKALAIEMSEQKNYDFATLDKLYRCTNNLCGAFGIKLAELLNEKEQKEFVTNSLKVIATNDKLGYIIFTDFVRSLNESLFQWTFEQMKKLPNKELLFAVIGIRNYSFEHDYVNKLFALIKENEAKVENFNQLLRFIQLSSHSESETALLIKKILELKNSFNTVLHISMMLFWSNIKNEYPIIETIITEEIIKQKHLLKIYIYNENYWQIINIFLAKGNHEKLAIMVCEELINILANTDMDLYGRYNIETAFRNLINKYFDFIWKPLSEALACPSERCILFYKLKSIIGNQILSENESCILFETDHTKVLLDWCNENPEVAPERLIQLVPLYNGKRFSDIVYILLSKYGKQEKVLTELRSRLATFGITGSAIPLYQHQLDAISTLDNHSVKEVKIWAKKMTDYLKKVIAEEQDFDEESFLAYRS